MHVSLCKQVLCDHAKTHKGGQLPQQESLKSDKDEGQLPVRPVQLFSQWKP